MTPTFLDSVLRGAESLAARDAVGTLPDPDLLRRFAAERDPAAFAVLLRRHGPLVWGVCRNLLPADADAEDAFQATFLALVRSAGSVRRAEALGGWLHGVAYRIAMKARRSAARRRQRESAAAVKEPDAPVADAAWDELQAAVHAEVCRLPEKLRLPFVLCGLQGRQQADAARQLGWKVGTLSARLTQARQRLLDRLARRGVPVGVAAGAAVLGVASGTAAVPASVCMKTLAAARDPASASEIVLSLARGVSVMTVTRTKLLAVAVLAAGVLTTGIGARFLNTADAQPPSRHTDADQVKKALDLLRKVQAQDRWEYKFIPMEKLLRLTDLQAVLRTAELEGWEYCGSQDIATADDTPRTVPHLAFKRPRGPQVADHSNAAAALAALAAANDKTAQEAAVRRAADDAVARLHAERLKAAEAALLQERDRAEAALARERDRAGRLELLLRDGTDANDAFLKKMKDLEAAAKSPVVPRPPTANLVVPLRHVTTRHVLKILDAIPNAPVKAVADERTNSIIVHGPPDVLAKVKEAITTTLDVPAKGDAWPDPNQTVRVQLKNVDGKLAATRLGDIMPGAKIVVEVHPDAIVLTGSAQVLDAARKHIETIDVKPTGPATARAANIELAVIPLKHANPKDVLDQVAKVLNDAGVPPYKAEVVGNSIVVAGPAEAVLNVRKVAEALDRPSSKRPQ